MPDNPNAFSWLLGLAGLALGLAVVLLLAGLAIVCKRRAPKPDSRTPQREPRNSMVLSRKCIVCACEIVVTAVDKTRGRCASCGQPWAVSHGLIGRKRDKP